MKMKMKMKQTTQILFCTLALILGSSALAAPPAGLTKTRIGKYDSQTKTEVLGEIVVPKNNDTNPDNPFPPVEELRPIRFGTTTIKVTKATTRYVDGNFVINFEEVCKQVVPTAVFDARGKDEFSVSPPEETYLRCQTIYQGQPITLISYASILMDDFLAPGGNEAKNFWAGTWLDLSSDSSSAVYLELPNYDVSTRDIGLTNIIFEEQKLRLAFDDGCSPLEPIDPNSSAKAKQDDSDDEDDCPTDPIDREPTEQFFVDFDMNDLGA